MNKMPVRRIALIDVIADTQLAFSSMLHVIAGRTRCRWEVVDNPEEADLILTQLESENASKLSRWSDSDKPFVSIVGPKSRWPLVRYALSQPFRANRVEAILDEIAGEIETRDVDASRHLSAAAMQAWNFPRALKALSFSVYSDSDYCARAASGDLIWIAADLSMYAADRRVIEQVRAGTLKFESLISIGSRRPPAKFEPRPLQELFWFAAFHASEVLAPWLLPDTVFRLRRWPDFGALRVPREIMQITALLAARPCSAADLCRQSGLSMFLINRTINALWVSRLLLVQEAGRAAVPVPSNTRIFHAPGIIKSLIGGLRKRLGLG